MTKKQLIEMIRKVIREEANIPGMDKLDRVGDLKIGDKVEIVSINPPHNVRFTGKILWFQNRGNEVAVGDLNPKHPSLSELVVDTGLVNKIY